MKTFFSPTRALIVMASIAALATPAMALDIQAPDLDPGPGLDFPDEIAPPANNGGGGGNGGGGSDAPQLGDNGTNFGQAPTNPCPGGELQVSFEFDDDGHPIPTSFERVCIPLL